MKEIDAKDVDALKGVYTIIDCREEEELMIGKVDGSRLVPLSQVTANGIESFHLSKTEKYAVYCAVGIRSKQLCIIMDDAGYDVTNINGGYREYSK